MANSKDKSDYRSISVSTPDYDDYDTMRIDFAKAKGIPTSKVSMAMIIRVAMSFYKQRSKIPEVGSNER